MTAASSDPGAEAPQSESAPALSVVRGEPTAEELAALVAVIASRCGGGGLGGGESSGPPEVSGWTDRARYVQGRLPHSPDGWRASALPR